MKTVHTLAVLALLVASFVFLGACAASRAGSFATPTEAVERLAATGDDQQAADELLGADGFALLRSGDDVADRKDLDLVRALIRERVEFEDVAEDCKVAHLGVEGWELPIPLVRAGGRWRFDVEAGREEIQNRRVGRNELSTIASLHAFVDAQREYASESRDGNPPAFARRFLSAAGRHDGLYWPVAEGQSESPLGPLVAAAADEGYHSGESKPIPYHGYEYRVLTLQGEHAPGGVRNYLDAHGLLTGGFAVLAWPATYGNSGVMTFVVNHRGIVYQKDLGSLTEQAAFSIQAYDPDASWSPTTD